MSLTCFGGFGLDVPYTDSKGSHVAAASSGLNCGDPKALQAMLNDLGYGPLTVDGIVGNNTFFSLADFAADEGIDYNTDNFPQGKICDALIAAWQKKMSGGSVAPSTSSTSKLASMIAKSGLNAKFAPVKKVAFTNTKSSSASFVDKAEDWWEAQPTTMKVAIVGGGVVVVGLVYYLATGGGSYTPNRRSRR